jgi:hypothetical protein
MAKKLKSQQRKKGNSLLGDGGQQQQQQHGPDEGEYLSDEHTIADDSAVTDFTSHLDDDFNNNNGEIFWELCPVVS